MKKEKNKGINNKLQDMPSSISKYLNYLNVIKGYTNATLYAYRMELIVFFKYLQYIRDQDTIPNLCLTNSDNNNNESINDLFKQKYLNCVTLLSFPESYLLTIETDNIINYLSYCKDVRNNNETSIRRKIATLQSFFTYHQEHTKLIVANPMKIIDMPKLNIQQPIYLSFEESKSLLSAIDSRNLVRDYCIIVLFLNYGLRLSELCGIDLHDIDNDTLLIRGKGKRERTIYLNDSTLDAIDLYLPIRDQKIESKLKREETLRAANKDPKLTLVSADAKKALFLSERISRINKRTVQDMVNKYLIQASLDNRGFSVHKLRHSAASLLYKDGEDIASIQELLGHNSIETTRLYIHINEERMRQLSKNMRLNSGFFNSKVSSLRLDKSSINYNK